MPLHRSTNRNLGLALISAGSLAFEVSLTRLFAVQQFHHFAFVVVSLAVMGIAASGLLIALRPKHPPLALLALVFSSSIGLAYLTINFLPFDSYSIAWDRKQMWILLLYFLVAGAPFLFAGWTVGACLADSGPDAHRPYAANLLGSALGCPIALIALAMFGGEGAIALAMLLGLISAIVLSPRLFTRVSLAFITALIFIIGIHPPSLLKLRISPYKPLAITRLVPDASPTFNSWSASTRLDIIESSSVHILPGQSLNAPTMPPLQAALFLDGDGPIPISALSPDDAPAKSLASYTPTAVIYDLRPNARVLILQPGAGLDAILALASGASQVTLAFDEPLVRQVLAGPYAEFSHHLLYHPKLTVSPSTGRGTLRRGVQNFDVIIFSLSEGFRPVTSGAFSLSENYTLTVEALNQAYGRLTNDGLLVITRWLGTPPSESARAWSMLLTALEAYGTDDLDSKLIAFRSMRTATMIASRRSFSPTELAETRAFLERNGYDPIHLPDLDLAELNQHNRLPQDVYHEIYTSLLNDRASTIANYDFNLRPPTDDRPFFFHFFRWRQTPDVLATLGQTWQPFGGSGYLVLLALLGLMVALAVPLAVAPLIVVGRAGTGSTPGFSALVYFACLGVGYLMVEIPLIQKLALLLDRPVIALATVLFTLLLASGIGSLISPRLGLRKALGILVFLLILTTAGISPIVNLALPWSFAARLLTAVLIQIPIGILMGVPFVAGLRQIEIRSPGSIPWAWAVNGSFSGVSGVLAAMVSLDAGFTATLAVGGFSYVIAWILSNRLVMPSQGLRD